MPKYVAAWYDFRNSTVCLKQEHTGYVDVHNFPYYFFIRGKPNRFLIDRFNDVEMDGDYCKVYIPPSSASRKNIVSELENIGIDTYEGDISAVNRFLTDVDIEFGNLKILYYDLETDGSSGWDRLDLHRILMVGYYSSVDGKYGSIVAKNSKHGERDAIEQFIRLVESHDLLVAWNGDAYDEIVLKDRAQINGLGDKWSEHWRGVNFLDMMKLFKKYYLRDGGSGARVSFALDNIGKTILGVGKIKKPLITKDGVENPVKAILDTWENDPSSLVEYCVRDVEIMVEIERKLGFLSFHKILSNLCGRFLSSFSLFAGYLNDAFVLRYGRKNGFRFRTKFVFYDERNDIEKIAGAYVMDPVAGLHSEVCDLDFASLYPNIIRTFNISSEVKINGKKGPLACNGIRFSGTTQGIFPRIVEETLNLRKKYKKNVIELESTGKEGTIEYLRAKQMSDAYKLLGNTMYGIMASPMMRYYDVDCGEAVTKSAKAIILYMIESAKKEGLTVIYSDTDSVFLKCSKQMALDFSAKSAGLLDEFVGAREAKPGFIRFDLDVVYDRILFVVKKRYAGVKDSGVLDIKGLEFVRTDQCKMARDMQKRIIEYSLMANSPNAAGAAKIVEWYMKKVFEGKAGIEDIVMAQSLGKPIDEYKVDTPHVRIAKMMMASGKEVYAGMKIAYVIIGVCKTKPIVVHVDNYAGKYDEKYYWTKKIYPPTRSILEVVFPMESDKKFFQKMFGPKK